MPRETGRRLGRSSGLAGASRRGGAGGVDVLKGLYLLRHAKAVPHGTMNDFDRVLADRGRSDMALLARHLAALDPAPDLALVSPAARTRETWALAGLPRVPVRIEEAIYEASARTLLRLVQALPDKVGLPILVGHNPGLEDFAASLPAPESPLRSLPTAGLVLAEWPVPHWRDVRPGEGRLVRVLTPAALGGGP